MNHKREFENWLRDAHRDLEDAIAEDTDIEAELANTKGPGTPVRPDPAVRERLENIQGRKHRSWLQLTDTERAALAEAGYNRVWQPGHVLALQGGPPRGMFVILRGWVRITAANHRGDSVPLAARGPGEIVGELSPMSGLPRMATIQALDEVETLVVPRDRLLAVLGRHPGISEELLRTAAIRLLQTDRLGVEAGGSHVPQRLAAVLLERALKDDPEWHAAIDLHLSVTQDDLASHAQVSRRALTRGLNELRTQGVIQTGRQRVTIIRPDVLRELAAGTTPAPEIYAAAAGSTGPPGGA
ncbi:MAG TPA: Crp/Fnr family transcriptional regulator [Actinophytocola sp.]|nr:Crp/Fnr family transcriptional regulator [Actinophytocola sp.]